MSLETAVNDLLWMSKRLSGIIALGNVLKDYSSLQNRADELRSLKDTLQNEIDSLRSEAETLAELRDQLRQETKDRSISANHAEARLRQAERSEERRVGKE